MFFLPHVLPDCLHVGCSKNTSCNRQHNQRNTAVSLLGKNTGLYIYRVFKKEWCGLKNLLNDYILQLDGAPPIFTEMYESYCSPTSLDRTCCKWRQPHTHTIWDEFDYRVDVCRVTQGANIEGL
jgi:hypothetical protein